MKKIVALSLLLLALSWTLSEAAQVRGHYRKDGTYVAPHQRSTPDGNPYNNYNFPGNYNPNKGEITPGDSDKYLERYRQQQQRNRDNSILDR
jgi:hypothetical protein